MGSPIQETGPAESAGAGPTGPAASSRPAPRNSRPFSRRLLVIGIGDLAVLGAVLTIGLAQRASLAAAGATLQPRLLWYATLALVWLGVSSALRVYDLQKAYSLAHSLKSAMGAAAVASVLYLCIPFFTPTLPTRRLQAAYFVFLAATGVGLWRL